MATILTELDRLIGKVGTLRQWASSLQESNEVTAAHAEYFQQLYLNWFTTTRLLLPQYYHDRFVQPYEGTETVIASMRSLSPNIRSYITEPLITLNDYDVNDPPKLLSTSALFSATPVESRRKKWKHPYESYFRKPLDIQLVAAREGRSYYAAVETVAPLRQQSPPTIGGMNLHPAIVRVSVSRYDAGLFVDAVEKAFLEVNSKVREKSGVSKEVQADGASLMEYVFSKNRPTLQITKNKKDQQAYMNLFVGAWGAVRNPRAHTNNIVDEARAALELLSFASALMRLVDASVVVPRV